MDRGLVSMRYAPRCLVQLVASAAFFLVVDASMVAQAQSPCPPREGIMQPPPISLAAPAATLVPDDACIPLPVPLPSPVEYFDDYSWRIFIALVWPARSGERGVPDLGLKLEKVGEQGATPLVFETYKADWETF